VSNSFWNSDTGQLVVLAACFVAVFVVAMMVIGIRERGKRIRSLAQRLGRRSAEQPAEQVATQWMPAGIVHAGQRVAMSAGFSAALDARLERAGITMLPGEFVALTAACALAGGVFAAIVLPSVVFVLMLAALTGAGPWVWVTWAHGRREQKLVDQLADTLSILASSLRAGHSFLQALDMVAKEIGEPAASEFSRVVAEIRLGRPIDEALTAMAERIGSDDLKWAVIAVNIQRQVGGNLAEVLDIVATTVRERAYIRRQIKVLSAEGRLSVFILSVLPILIGIYIAIVNPVYIGPLFTTGMGRAIIIAAFGLWAIGIVLMRKVVKIDV
jgi:tight adherence protein B